MIRVITDRADSVCVWIKIDYVTHCFHPPSFLLNSVEKERLVWFIGTMLKKVNIFVTRGRRLKFYLPKLNVRRGFI